MLLSILEQIRVQIVCLDRSLIFLKMNQTCCFCMLALWMIPNSNINLHGSGTWCQISSGSGQSGPGKCHRWLWWCLNRGMHHYVVNKETFSIDRYCYMEMLFQDARVDRICPMARSSSPKSHVLSLRFISLTRTLTHSLTWLLSSLAILLWP